VTNQNEQERVFLFDDTKSFAENCTAFLEQVKTFDSEMASILQDNWDIFLSIVHHGERNSGARSDFNTYVAKALDSLIGQTRSEGGD